MTGPIAGRYVDEEVALRDHPDGTVLVARSSGFTVEIHLDVAGAANLALQLQAQVRRLRGVPEVAVGVGPDDDTVSVEVP